jgi:hypothetical protein
MQKCFGKKKPICFQNLFFKKSETQIVEKSEDEKNVGLQKSIPQGGGEEARGEKEKTKCPPDAPCLFARPRYSI